MTKKAQEIAPFRLIEWCAQWQEKKDLAKIPVGARGVYALHDKKSDHYDVMYVGMSASGQGIKRRIRSHSKSTRKGPKWTHFSIFVVWKNIREEEIRELEALLREIYRKDSTANRLAKQKGSEKLRKIRYQDPNDWRTL